MNDAQPAPINAWSSEKDVIFPCLYALLYVFDAMKPSDVKKHFSVPEVSGQTMFASLSRFLETEELSQDLHKRHLGGQLAYFV